VSIKGSSYANFQRALKTGDLLLIRAAAAELPAINLEDALAICVLVRDRQPERFDRAVLRWLGRYCLERRGATLAGLSEAVDAFARFDIDRAASLATLERLARR
jgi:hypothetical protein